MGANRFMSTLAPEVGTSGRFVCHVCIGFARRKTPAETRTLWPNCWSRSMFFSEKRRMQRPTQQRSLCALCSANGPRHAPPVFTPLRQRRILLARCLAWPLMPVPSVAAPSAPAPAFSCPPRLRRAEGQSALDGAVKSSRHFGGAGDWLRGTKPARTRTAIHDGDGTKVFMGDLFGPTRHRTPDHAQHICPQRPPRSPPPRPLHDPGLN